MDDRLHSPVTMDTSLEDYAYLLRQYKELMLSENNPNVTNVIEKITKIIEWRRGVRLLCGDVTTATAAAGDANTPTTSSSNLSSASHLQSHHSTSFLVDHLTVAFEFWGSGVSVAALGGAGLVGNMLSFVTIVTMKKRNLFNNLLLTLTLFDIVFIVNGGLFFMQRAFGFNSDVYVALFPTVIFPLAGISMTGSTYTCIAIALERYLGICYSQSDFVIRKSRYYICAILLLATFIDFPRFLETKAVYNNSTGIFEKFEYTDMRKNTTYITVYTLWFRLISTAALPFTLMLFFNLKILIYYRRNSFAFGHQQSHQQLQQQPQLQQLQRQHSMASSGPSVAGVVSAGSGNNVSSSNTSQERSLYITFFCLTTTFLVCHLPRILMNINEMQMTRRRQLCREEYDLPYIEPAWVSIALSLEKILLVFNSSINFVYYCLVGKTFRQHMCRALFWWCLPCLRAVGVGLDLTTTAGTGETTVPDIETTSRVRHSSRHFSCDLLTVTEVESRVLRSLISQQRDKNDASQDGTEDDGTRPLRRNVSIREKMVVRVDVEDSDIKTSAATVAASTESLAGFYDINICLGTQGEDAATSATDARDDVHLSSPSSSSLSSRSCCSLCSCGGAKPGSSSYFSSSKASSDEEEDSKQQKKRENSPPVSAIWLEDTKWPPTHVSHTPQQSHTQQRRPSRLSFLSPTGSFTEDCPPVFV